METLVLKVNLQQIQVINAGLVEMPWKLSNPIIVYINNQIKHQEAEEKMVAAKRAKEIKKEARIQAKVKLARKKRRSNATV